MSASAHPDPSLREASWDQIVAYLDRGGNPAEIAEQLKAESERQLHLNPEEALRVASLIGQLAERADGTGIRALGRLATADALRELGRYGEALAEYTSAASIYDALQDEVGWARSRVGATVTWRYTGVTPENLAEIDRARTILFRHGLWLRLARLEQHAGTLFTELGQLENAAHAYQRALEAARRLEPRDHTQEARILGNSALVWQRLGEYERAEALQATALAVFEEHGHVRELAVGKAISAQLAAEQGHYSRSLEMAVSARRTFLELGQVIDGAFSGRVGAYCLLALNRFEEAAELASRVITEFETANAAINQAGSLLLRSRALRRLDRVGEALADLDRAEHIFAASECQGWVAIVRGERAAVLVETESWDAAASQAQIAGQELETSGQVVSAAEARLVQAVALRRMGDTHRASEVVRNVVATIRGRSVPWLEFQARRLDAELALELGRDGLALDAYDASIRALEQVQGRILTEARSDFLADKLDVYEAAVNLCLERGDTIRAFEYAERAKSRALVDTLAGRLDIRIRPRTPTEERLAQEFRRLRRRHDQLSALASDAMSPLAEDQSTPPELPDEELMACERQMSTLLDELRLANVADLERVSLLQGRTYPLELDERTRLVEYYSTGEDLCVFVGSPPNVDGWRLPGARSRVERLSRLLQLAMQTPMAVRRDERQMVALERAAQQLLGRLYDELFAPFSASLHGVERLVIVPHGSLHRIPFAALHDGTGYLVERYELVVGPSASAMAFCRRKLDRVKRRALVMGHSDHGALPGATREAERVAALLRAPSLLEENATLAKLIEKASGADVIHLAAHGLARIDAPLFSYLQLDDARLTALDCFDFELDCALVTLSACESGWARVVAGDEQMGLSRAFLYAGARSVLQTLWRVDDETMAQLMERFYRGLLAEEGRAHALRMAQLEILRETSGRSHPFFWAPAILVGDWVAMPNLAMLGGD